MTTIDVYDKEQLASALENKIEKIMVYGELAAKVKQSYQIKKYSTVAIGAMGVAIAAASVAPFTGGLSLVVATPIAMSVALTTGIDVAIILAVIFLGLGMVLLMTKNYKILNFKLKMGEYGPEIALERKL